LGVALIPLMSLYVAAGPNGAVLHTTGSASVNGTAVSHSSAIFPGDVLQTGTSSQANINASGASVTVAENSSLRFEDAGVSIVEGLINIVTSRRDLATTAGIVKVTPASDTWTEFEISRRNGSVQITARKGDINVSAGSETFTLLQGQSDTRDDFETETLLKKKSKDNEPPPAATGPVMNSRVVIGVGAGAVAGGLIYALTRSGAPVSPVTP
jgi:ferric-dicitrate binding protein FerR (iron transport regulator)